MLEKRIKKASCQTYLLVFTAIHLFCRSLESKEIPMADHGVTVLLTNSNVSHELIHTEYPKRVKQCKEAAGILGVDSLRDVTLDALKRKYNL